MANDAMPLLSFFGERMNEIGSDQEPSFVSLDASVLSHPNKISDFSGGVAGVEGLRTSNNVNALDTFGSPKQGQEAQQPCQGVQNLMPPKSPADAPTLFIESRA